MGSFKIRAVKMNCRNCGSEALSDEFKLDTIKGVMICPNCEKRVQKDMIQKDIEAKPIEKRPAGWDELDEYLEKNYKQKNEKSEELSLKNPYKNLTCDKCEYKFRYNTIKQWPKVCPSCSKKI